MIRFDCNSWTPPSRSLSLPPLSGAVRGRGFVNSAEMPTARKALTVATPLQRGGVAHGAANDRRLHKTYFRMGFRIRSRWQDQLEG